MQWPRFSPTWWLRLGTFVTSLDREVECLSRQVETLEVEKEMLEGQVKQQAKQLVTEGSRRKILEENMAWLHKQGFVRVVGQVIESPKFLSGVRQMKATCMVAGVEGGKKVVREQVATRKFSPEEENDLLKQTQVVHASVKAFMETDFASYLHLGE